MPRATAVTRGFTLIHQRVVLDLGFGGTIAGFTELTIVPTDRNLKVVHLNCRQAVIQKVTCSGHDADFSYNDHLTAVTISDNRDVHRYPELKRKVFAAASDGANGELSILLPPEIRIQPQFLGGSASRSASLAPEEAPTPGGSSGTTEYTPITVRVEYYIKDPAEGIQFMRPSADSPYRVPHLFTVASCPDSARCWVPCVDSLWERCTWELNFIVPKQLASDGDDQDQQAESHPDQDDELQDSQVIVVSTGDLMEQVTHPNNSSKTIFCFTQAVPTSVQHIGFAAGPFHMLRIGSNNSPSNTLPHQDEPNATSALLEQTSGQPEILAFCLPGRENDLSNSVSFTRHAIDFFSRDFGSYPFGSFRMVFVDEPPQECAPLSMMSICSTDLLHPPSVIDQALENRHILSYSIAFQWVGINIIQATWADTWLINGLGLYITGLFLRKLLGNNEYRFRLKKDCDRLCAWDIGMPPLYEAGAFEPPDAATLPFVNLKAPLVLHILDRRLCKMGASVGLGRVIPKIFLQAMTGEMSNNALSTHHFLRVCRKVSGADLRLFTEQWIRGSGCPRFYCSANFNRKKLLIEMYIRQEAPAAQYAAARPYDSLSANAVPMFEGQMTVRIHEADGTPYEHVLDIKGPAKRYEVPFNTKYKRVRRNTKRFQARQAAAAAAAQGDQEAAEAIGLIDLGFGLGMWEDEKAREEWKVADWTEEDEEKMSSAPYEWIRMDADLEWLASIHFEQPDYMWVSQLQRDRDVVAQVAAVHALAQMPSLVTCSMLTRTVLVPKYFYRVRTEAVHGLANCALPQLDYLGFFHLLKLFRTQCCHDPPEDENYDTPLDVPCIPRANEFADAADYFIQRALIHAISRVRNPKGRTLPQVKRFLINLLRYNDNSTNQFVDDFYLAGIMNALASAFIPVDSVGGYVPSQEDDSAAHDISLLSEATAEVERLQELDKLVPSYHNVVTLGALDFQVTMMLANLKPRDLQLFFSYTRQGNFTPVRIAALNSLLLVANLDHKVVARYCFSLLRFDENRNVKRALARALCEGLAVAISTGVFGGGALRGPESFLIEENSGHAGQGEKNRDAQLEAMLKTLKKEIGRSAGVREGFLGALLTPNVDSEARWALIKLGELLFRPAEERDLPLQPKVQLRVRMPSFQAAVASEPNADSPTSSKIKLVRRPSVTADVASGTLAKRSALRVAFETPEKPAPVKTKLKKPKPLAPGQASGMSYADLTACRNTLKKLMENKYASIFLHPVDPVRDQATDYFDVIKNPMDLDAISNKLDSGQYKDRFGFRDDFDLMIQNAKTYTPDPKAWVHQQALGLEKVFTQLWTRMEKTLEQSAAKQRAAQESASALSASVKANDSHAEKPKLATPLPHTPSSASSPTLGKLSVKVKLKTKVQPAASPAQEPRRSQPPPAPAATPAVKTPVPALADVPPAEKSASKLKKTLIKLKKKEDTPLTPTPAPKRATPLLPVPSDPKPKAGSSTVDDDILEALGEPSLPPSKKSTPAPKKLKTSESLSSTPSSTKKVSKVESSSIPPSPSPLGNSRSSTPLNGTVSAATASPSKSTSKNAEIDPIGASAGLPMHAKRCKAVLQILKKSPFSIFFRFPVDPIRDGLPTYLEEIKHPMDLSTIEKKINQGTYKSMSNFAADVELVLNNCRQFNPPGTEPCQHADQLEKLWRKEWAKVLIPKLENQEKRALQAMLNKLKNHQTSLLFREPVDPIKLGVPTYFDIIPRKDARDLSLIESKLKSDKYDSIDSLDQDIKLMLHNCYTFNVSDPAITEITKTFETVYKKDLVSVKSQCGYSGSLSSNSNGGGGNKRKEKEDSSSTNSKKQKIV